MNCDWCGLFIGDDTGVFCTVHKEGGHMACARDHWTTAHEV